MLLFIICYGIVLLVVSAFIANNPNYLGNVGFLILGALLGSYPPFLIAEYESRRDAKRIAVAIFQEVANRVARCCFDFEKPWGTLYLSPKAMEGARLRKFAPEPPIIYPALAPQIAIFKNDVGQALIRFYIFLSAWQKNIEISADEITSLKAPGAHISARQVLQLARRLRNTLKPGLDILEKLGPLVPGAEQIELDAIVELDNLFPEDHPNAGKPLRERILIELNKTKSRTT